MSALDLVAETVATAAAGAGLLAQDTRLLRLHAPGGEGLLAERATVHEAIVPRPGLPAALRIELLALATDTAIDLQGLLGQPVLLELLLNNGGLRPWHAHVGEAALLGSDGGLARYRLVLEPWLAFLAHRVDGWAFQDRTVIEIVDEVFADHAQGALVPAWRWELADAAAYPRRSLCIQYQESDLDFVLRLLREEGLFCWFEHAGNAATPALGAHTLVIADHNDAFAANAQAAVRYTQAAAVLAEDSLTRWREGAAGRSARLAQASRDYRSRGLRPVEQSGNAAGFGEIEDVPGLYAYESAAQGERLALRQMQALDAQREQVAAAGTLRRAAPGTIFTFTDHPRHDGSDDERDRFVVLAATHRMRNNLRADPRAALQAGGAPLLEAPGLPNAGDEPLFAGELVLQRAALPVRPAAFDARGLPDVRLAPRPTVHGVQTAIVVGPEPVHTDRDHRIKIQFHWQRGQSASHRLDHPSGSNAPADDGSGTWVRVAESVAGANWGGHFVPRVGQEVLVGFVGGDIDRPVVVGSLYNGRGSADAQGNEVAAGAARTNGSAPAWFPGEQAGGRLQAHRHAAVLSGHKSQELAASAHGSGGCNQLVFDDSPGQGRIELSSTSAQTRLQLGHLLHQADNQRLQPRGHGIDLATQAWGALRAGAGLLLSAHARGPQPQSVDAREAQRQLGTARELVHALSDSAGRQNARLAGEDALAAERGLADSEASLAATATQGDGSGAIGGGQGTAAAWQRPELVVGAAAGIAAHTPAHFVAGAGRSVSLSAGQDLQHLSQAHHSLAAKDGLVLYTFGQATNPEKPNQETGLQLHAASGNVNTQSQSGATRLTADAAVDVASTQGMVRIAAPGQVLLTAGGSAVEIGGADITLRTAGKVEFKGSMKEWAGGGNSGSFPPFMPTPLEFIPPSDKPFSQTFDVLTLEDDCSIQSDVALQPYRIYSESGKLLQAGMLHSETLRVFTANQELVRCEIGIGAWDVVESGCYDMDDTSPNSEGLEV